MNTIISQYWEQSNPRKKNYKAPENYKCPRNMSIFILTVSIDNSDPQRHN